MANILFSFNETPSPCVIVFMCKARFQVCCIILADMGRTQGGGRGEKRVLSFLWDTKFDNMRKNCAIFIPPPISPHTIYFCISPLVTEWSIALKKRGGGNFNSLKSKPLNWVGSDVYCTGRKLWHIRTFTLRVEAYGLDDFSLNHVIFHFYFLPFAYRLIQSKLDFFQDFICTKFSKKLQFSNSVLEMCCL